MDEGYTLIGHLDELRKRIIICLAFLGFSSAIGFFFASSMLRILKLPAAGVIEKLVFFSPQEAFLIYMRIAFFCGIFISAPMILYQIFAFVSPAIGGGLKKHIGFFLIICFLSFVTGGLFAYFILIPPALKFLLSFARGELEPVISASKYISFIISLILGVGLVFQMPVLAFSLSKLSIVNHRFLRRKFKYAIVIIFIAAAAITPTTDIFNMLMLAIPMLVLYEVSIWASFLARTKIR